MKLKILLLLRYRLIYIVIALVLLILVINSIWYFSGVLLYGWYLYKNQKDLLKVVGIILFLYIGRIVIFESTQLKESAQYNVVVTKDLKVSDYTSFTGRYKLQVVKGYINDPLPLRPGDSLVCTGEIKRPINNTTPQLFNYKNYLKSQNIKVILVMDTCEVVDNKLNINRLSYKINNYIDTNFIYSKEYLKTFILADKSDFDQTFINEINKVGISHLFAVSGLHISLIVLTIFTLLKSFKINEKIIEYIVILFLVGYMIITTFTPSVTRAALMFVFLVLNKRLGYEFSSIDILSFVFIILLFIKPYYYYNIGFTLSFLVTFLILLSNKILTVNNKLKPLIIITTIAFLGTVPLILSLNYQINLLTLGFNLFFLGYVTYFILPLGYFTFIFAFLDKLYYQVIKIFESLLHFSSLIDYFIISMTFPNQGYVIFYYCLLFYALISYESKKTIKKPLIALILFLIFTWSSPYYNIVQKVTFLDIYGDSTVIIDRFDKCNIVIDTGEVDEYDTVVNYLKTNNIRRIDYLIITHYHSDHYGETNDLLNNFNVVNLVNRDNLDQYPSLNKCGNIEIYLYPNDESYTNENNRSIILSLFISDKHYLFTGDIEAIREENFIKKYSLDVDYVKVPHHGSITSSSQTFIEAINPEEVFIIVSRENRNNHPSEIVVSRYEQLGIKVYRTDLDGTIVVSYVFGKEFKKIHRP